MQLCIHFDEQTMKENDKNGIAAFFVIYWQVGDIDYPGFEWTDFGVVVLEGWLAATIKLLKGSECEKMAFYDGFYSMTVKRIAERLIFSAYELIPLEGNLIFSKDEKLLFECSLQHFLSLLLEAVNTVRKELNRLEVDQSGQNSLLAWVEQLY